MLDLGVTGPMLRAAGLKIDTRKDAPYSSYEKFDFEVPTRTENDVYARYQVRDRGNAAERPDRQAGAGRHAGGPWKADAPHVVLPDREKMKTQMEALIYHFKIVTEGFRVPEGEVFQVIESPRGELGYYVVSDGTRSRTACTCAHRASAICRRRAENGGRHSDRRCDRRDRQHGFRSRGHGPVARHKLMTFSPQLEARFDKLLKSYPPGRQRSAMIPMLLYAQDEIGVVHGGTDRRSRAPRRRDAAAGGRSAVVLLHAASQAAGEVSRADLHQYQLPAARRRRALGARLQEARHRT